MAARIRTSRKILVASLGVASVTYIVACGGQATTGGLEGGVQAEATDEFPVGNLAGSDATLRDVVDEHPVGNLGVPIDAAGPSDHTTIDEFPVANLVVVPD